MASLKIVIKEAIDTVQEAMPQAARAVGRQSRHQADEARDFARRIRDEDAELAAGQRRPDRTRGHDAPDRATSNAPGLDAPTVDVTLRSFKRNRKHDPVEYDRQLDQQLAALQEMPLDQWRRNREAYLSDGRSSASEAAQRNARVEAVRNRETQLLAEGVDYDDAEAMAEEWARSMAATHRLDGIAGGDQTDISGLGESRINASLGSQWRSRVGALDAAVEQLIRDNPGIDLSSMRFKIRFI